MQQTFELKPYKGVSDLQLGISADEFVAQNPDAEEKKPTFLPENRTFFLFKAYLLIEAKNEVVQYLEVRADSRLVWEGIDLCGVELSQVAQELALKGKEVIACEDDTHVVPDLGLVLWAPNDEKIETAGACNKAFMERCLTRRL